MTGLKDISETIPRYRMDKAFYDRVKASPKRKLVDKFTIPPHSGRGAVVKGGQAFRVVNTEGPQVGDVALWNAHNYKEQMSSARTWQMAGYVIRPFSRVWSDAPWLRPMVTCTEDTVVTLPKGSRLSPPLCPNPLLYRVYGSAHRAARSKLVPFEPLAGHRAVRPQRGKHPRQPQRLQQIPHRSGHRKSLRCRCRLQTRGFH